MLPENTNININNRCQSWMGGGTLALTWPTDMLAVAGWLLLNDGTLRCRTKKHCRQYAGFQVHFGWTVGHSIQLYWSMVDIISYLIPNWCVDVSIESNWLTNSEVRIQVRYKQVTFTVAGGASLIEWIVSHINDDSLRYSYRKYRRR